MKKFVILSLVGVLFAKNPLRIGDVPTGYTTPRGYFDFNLRMQKQGGLLLFMDVAVMDYLSIGISYGGMGIIGNEKIQWNPLPGVTVRYLVIYEGTIFPSMLIGLTTQGYDHYIESSERYEVKSKGAHLAISKRLPVLSGFIINGGINYTFERTDEKNGLDLFAATFLSLAPDFSIFSDWTLGYNDPARSEGILNIGAELSFEEAFFFRFLLRDLLYPIPNRAFEIGYRGYL